MKKGLLCCLALMLLFSLPVCAEENEVYDEQYSLSGAEELRDSLPEDAARALDELGADPADPMWTQSLTGEGVLTHLLSLFRSGLKVPLRTGFCLCAVLLAAGALSSMNGKTEASHTGTLAAALACALALAAPLFSAVNAAVSSLQTLSAFMLSFLPVFTGICAASGAAAAAASSGAVLLGCCEALSFLASYVVLPVLGGFLAISLISCVSPFSACASLAASLKKASLWLLSLGSVVFVGVLGAQTAVGSASDSIALKTAKFILGSAVPVAGSALSEAVSTVTASMGLLRASVGVYGVIAVGAIFLPILTELILWRLTMNLCSFFSDTLEQPKISGLLRAADGMLAILIGILLLIGAVFTISLATVLTFTKA